MALNRKNVVSIIFLLFFFVILAGFYSIVFRPQKNISEAEQRTLQKIPSFSLEKFASGAFQTEMDDAVSDQFIFSDEIKQLVKDFDNSLVSYTSRIFRPFSRTMEPDAEVVVSPVEVAAETATINDFSALEAVSESKDDNHQADNDAVSKITEEVPDNYEASGLSVVANENAAEDASKTVQALSAAAETAQVASSVPQKQKYDYIYTEVITKYIYKLDDSGYIIQKAADPNTYDFDLYDPDMLDKVTYPKYLYLINSSMSVDFREPQKYDALSVIKQKIKMDGYDELKLRNFDDYKKFFYQTDHHWNYRGSYEGYKQCIRMLEGDDVKVLEPTGTHTYHTIYNGSLARDNALKCSTEEFTVYEFDIPPYKTYVDDKEAVYGYRYLYVSDNDFPHNTYSNHYGMYYGDDHAKVVYVFDNPDAQSLLILGTSYSNAVNELIASHYKETHVLDFRHYRKTYGVPIDAQSYMEEHNLDKLLILGDISSIGHKVR